MNGAGMAPSSPVPRSALIACAHLVKERGALLSHALSSIEVHSGRPGFPVPPVVIPAGPVKSLVSRPPVGIVAQDIRKQTWRQIHGQLSAVPHGVALGLNPCHQVSCPMR